MPSAITSPSERLADTLREQLDNDHGRACLAEVGGPIEWELVDYDGHVKSVVVDPAAGVVGDVKSHANPVVTIGLEEHVLDELMLGTIDELAALVRGQLTMTGRLASALRLIPALPSIAARYRAKLPAFDGPPAPAPFGGARPDPELAHAVDGLPLVLTTDPADQVLLVAIAFTGLSPTERAIELANLWNRYQAGDINPFLMSRLIAHFGDLAARTSMHASRAHTNPASDPTP